MRLPRTPSGSTCSTMPMWRWSIPVSDRIAGNNEIACYELPGGSMARITHQGPYERSAAAYKNALRLDRGKSQESGRADPGGLSQRPTESHAGRSF